MRRRFTLPAATAVATAGLLVLGATGAAAHVTVDPSSTEAGSYSVLTFAVPHGCGDSPTTSVAIQVPEALADATPTVTAGWEIEKVMETLDPPVDDGHGGQLTERVAEIVYTTDTPLPDGYREAFELSVRLPDAPGETLAFPTVQYCEEGEAPWVQLPAEGQDAGELDMPAPAVTLTDAGAPDEPAAAPEGAAPTEADAAEGATPAGADAAGDASDGGSGAPAAVAWVALVLGAAGLLLGGAAFARSRRA